MADAPGEQRVELTISDAMAVVMHRWPASPATGYRPMVSVAFFSASYPGFTVTMPLDGWRKFQNAVALIDGSDSNVVSLHRPPDGGAA